MSLTGTVIDGVIVLDQPEPLPNGTKVEVQVKETSVVHDDLPTAFTALADRWRRETGMLSSITKKFNHPAYQKIIEMGEPVVPLILEEMKAHPAYWFKALETITGTSPIPKGQQVDFATATAAWLAWGKDRGYTKE